MLYRAAVIGDSQTVMGFKAVGLTTASANDGSEAAVQLHKLAESGYAVIYITEQLAAQIEEDMARYNDTAEVAVIPPPPPPGGRSWQGGWGPAPGGRAGRGRRYPQAAIAPLPP